jgi:hypothetical protein
MFAHRLLRGYCRDIEIGIGTDMDMVSDMRARHGPNCENWLTISLQPIVRLDFGARIWKEQIADFPI